MENNLNKKVGLKLNQILQNLSWGAEREDDRQDHGEELRFLKLNWVQRKEFGGFAWRGGGMLSFGDNKALLSGLNTANSRDMKEEETFS